jgi:hypothetical protein
LDIKTFLKLGSKRFIFWLVLPFPAMVVLEKEGEKEVKKLVSDLHLSCRIVKNRRVIIAPARNESGCSCDYAEYTPNKEYIHKMFDNPESLYNTDKSMPKAEAANLVGILQKAFAEADNYGKRTTVLDTAHPNFVNLPHENIMVELGVRDYGKLIHDIWETGGSFGRTVLRFYKSLRRCA